MALLLEVEGEPRITIRRPGKDGSEPEYQFLQISWSGSVGGISWADSVSLSRREAERLHQTLGRALATKKEVA